MSFYRRQVEKKGIVTSGYSCPFEVYYYNNSLTFTPGHINGLYPTNMFTALNFTDNGVPIYIQLSCVTDGSTITSATLITQEVTPSPIPVTQFLAPLAFQIPIAVIYNKAVLQVARGNIIAIPKVHMISSRPPPTPGEEPFIRWWTWLINQSC